MTHRLFFAIAVLTLVSCGHKPSGTNEISQPEKMTEKFFETYQQDGPGKALNSLLRTNKYIPTQEADSVVIKLENLVVSLGEYQGHEKIKESKYGQGITQLVYVVKYHRQPLRFNFRYYQPGSGWRIQNFSFEVDFLDELDETSRAVMLEDNYGK